MNKKELDKFLENCKKIRNGSTLGVYGYYKDLPANQDSIEIIDMVARCYFQ